MRLLLTSNFPMPNNERIAQVVHDDAEKPKLIRKKKKPESKKGVVTITFFKNGWCPVTNMTYERAKRAAKTFGEKVIFREINTINPKVIRDWGICDAFYIDKKEVRIGPPPSYDKIYVLIQKRVNKL